MAELTEALEQSTVAFGLRYNKVSVRPLLVFKTPSLSYCTLCSVAMCLVCTAVWTG